MQSTSEVQRPSCGLYREEFEHDACGIGVIAQLAGKRSHQILVDALSALINLEHRGGKGLESNTGDGAGVLFQLPHRFFRKEAQKEGHLLPEEGDYAVAMCFFPHEDPAAVQAAAHLFEEGCAQCGLRLLFWRRVPVNPRDLGATARACAPTIVQAFIRRPSTIEAGMDFERELYICRRIIERKAEQADTLRDRIFYICSMSARTIVYKGMLVATQMRDFYLDLNDAAVETSLALVHSRYSTNTTPSWERAHPNRYIIHNGEINTLRGNINGIRAREPRLYSPVLKDRLADVLPIINREGSDSAIFDNVFEFLYMNGRSLGRAISLMIPEPWENNPNISEKRRYYDEYQSMLLGPWDGPAAIAFTDGIKCGAILDRNGLRPARYYVTRDDRLILASEAGVIDVAPEEIMRTGNLKPGEMLIVDPSPGRILFNDELRDTFASEKPYRDWIKAETLCLANLTRPEQSLQDPADSGSPLAFRMAKLGYHFDDVDEVIRPMALTASPPLSSMGVDVPLACLSGTTRSFFDYFHQLFAQVTNPPIDALRERFITSTVVYVGHHTDLLEDSRNNCRLVRLERPILSSDEFGALCNIEKRGFSSQTLRAVYTPLPQAGALKCALDTLAKQAEDCVRAGIRILVISDRALPAEVPIPSLLALGCVHNHLIRCGLRTLTDIVMESGDVISPHDYACLIGYSAAAVFPYMAYECIEDLCENADIELECGVAQENYCEGICAGVLSIMSKMGISTVQGYHGAQIFEILGLSDEVVRTYFTYTSSRIAGLGIDDIERELNKRLDVVESMRRSPAPDQLPTLGLTKWRPQKGAEEHQIDPKAIYLLQRACRENDFELFGEYSSWIHRPGHVVTLRDLMEFVPAGPALDLSEVEPAEEIVKRFNTGAMSYGSISQEMHECLAIAMNRLHGRSNTGEGGESPVREVPLPGGDSSKSAIKQVASGRFGVTSRYLRSASEIQIKMAQGAKPGEGGHLPGKKVYPWIAEVRRSTPGVELISPPPHHDIYSIEDLAELIFDLKNANPEARISVKLCALAGVGTIACGVAKGGADKILISGHNGGTGAAPRDSIYHAGIPFEIGLSEAHQTLLLNGLRSRVILETDGKLMDGRDVAMAAFLGAEEFGFATMPLISCGCLMQRDCQEGTCPVGIATQNCVLRGRFTGKPEYVEHFMLFVAEQLRRIMASLGFRRVEDMVGRSDCLRQVKPEGDAYLKANTLDLSGVLARVSNEFGKDIPGASIEHYSVDMVPDSGLDKTLDATLFLPLTQQARTHLEPVRFSVDINNVNRCVGTMLGSAVTKSFPEGLPDESIVIDCAGSAGQSFGAFLPRGITLSISGDANDYFGKGLSGGILAVHPPREATYKFDDNVSVGNVAFYGATSGKGFINGLAGQRFAIRNSGATVVVEGVGSSGCEYMTGGVVLILGEVGDNFAAGMSGGIAYVYDLYGNLEGKCNLDLVSLKAPKAQEIRRIHELIREHTARTASPRGIKMLYQFENIKRYFVKVIPRRYEKVMELVEKFEKAGDSRAVAMQHAFDVLKGA